MGLVGAEIIKAPKATRRATGLLAAAGSLLASGVLVPGTPGQGLLAAGTVLAGLVAGLSLYGSAKIRVLPGLRVRRVFPTPLVEGRWSKVRLELENPSNAPLELLEFSDTLPPSWEARGSSGVVTVPPGGRTVVEYMVKPAPGRHTVGPLITKYRDPLGIVEGAATIGSEDQVVVYPRLLDVPRRMLPASAHSPAGSLRSRKRGLGLLFMEVREYHPEDDYRFIDWKSTARRGKPMVKVFEHEGVASIIVAIDLNPTMYSGRRGETKFEHSLRLAASLIEYLARRGYKYRLIVYPPSNGPRVTPWLQGRGSEALARKRLAEWSPWPRSLPRLSMGEWKRRSHLLAETILKSLRRSRSLVIVLSDLGESSYRAQAYGEALSRIRRLGHPVFTLTPLGLEFEASALGELSTLYRILALDKLKLFREISKELASKGIRLIALGPRDLLSVIIARLEAMAA